jgi:hypothetical protein
MKYYRTDSRKISFREYWNISRGGRFPFAALYKILGIPLKLTEGIPEPQPLRDRLIEAAAIPRRALEKLDPAILEFRELGFDQFWFSTQKDSMMIGSGYAVQTLHSSHLAIGKIISASYRTRENFVLAFFSRFKDGTILATTDKEPAFRVLPGYVVQRLPRGTGARRLWELHQKKLAAPRGDIPPDTFANFDQVAAFDDETVRAMYEDKIRRRIWVEMTEAEVAALRSKRQPPLPV